MAATIVGPINGITPGLPGGVSAAYQVNATGVLKNAPGVLAKVVCITAGSVTLNDSATTGGAAATNEIWSGSLTAGQILPLDWPCAAGICVSALTSAVLSVSFT